VRRGHTPATPVLRLRALAAGPDCCSPYADVPAALLLALRSYWAKDTTYASANGGPWQFFIDDGASGGQMGVPLQQAFWEYLHSSSKKEWGLATYEQVRPTKLPHHSDRGSVSHRPLVAEPRVHYLSVPLVPYFLFRSPRLLFALLFAGLGERGSRADVTSGPFPTSAVRP
jgi:hypothetical protein